MVAPDMPLEEAIMPRWEYRKIDLNDVPPKTDEMDLLDRAGSDGWELIGITVNNFAYLKRRADDVETTVGLPARHPVRRKASS
jgi:hypothetical protein